MRRTKSDTDNKHMTVSFPCSKRSFAPARQKINKFARDHGFGKESEDVALAVQEALKNIMQHACPADGKMRLSIESNGERLIIEVSDTGGGFDIEAIEKANPEPMGVHGRGIQLIKGLMDRVRITSDSEGTVVHMEKDRSSHLT